LRHRAAAQFAAVAGPLLKAGLTVPESLRLAGQAAGSIQVQAIADDAARRTTEGAMPAAAMADADTARVLPPELHWYLRVGEQAGDLPTALARAAHLFGERLQWHSRALSQLIMPVGVLVTGVVVGLFAYTFFGAMVGWLEALAP
jgi:general secretion pathway protein F